MNGQVRLTSPNWTFWEEGDLPDRSVGAGSNRGQSLVPLRDFPYRLVHLLSIKIVFLWSRHSCRTNCRPPTDFLLQGGGLRAAQSSTLPKCKKSGAKRKVSRPRRNWCRLKLPCCLLVKFCNVCTHFSGLHVICSSSPCWFSRSPEISPHSLR